MHNVYHDDIYHDISIAKCMGFNDYYLVFWLSTNEINLEGILDILHINLCGQYSLNFSWKKNALIWCC